MLQKDMSKNIFFRLFLSFPSEKYSINANWKKKKNSKSDRILQLEFLSDRIFQFFKNLELRILWCGDSAQTVQAQVRLFFQKQSDLGQHCLPHLLHLLDTLLSDKTTLF